VTNVWVPQTLRYCVLGFAGGAVLGLVGLKLTHWEPGARGLHYTPPRLLVLLITVALTARVIYGLWRAWHAWDSRQSTASWLSAAGAAGSLAVGAIVLGYYLIYWAGVARRVKARGKLNVINVR